MNIIQYFTNVKVLVGMTLIKIMKNIDYLLILLRMEQKHVLKNVIIYGIMLYFKMKNISLHVLIMKNVIKNHSRQN